jgi:uncharacterized membrane protein HdeD (DUF308 family)
MNRLVRDWWMMAVRGVLALGLGAAVLGWPGLDLGELVVLFGCYAVVDGAWTVVAALRASGRSLDAWPVGLEGLVSLVLGGLALLWPMVSAADVRLMALWGVATGVLELAAASRLPRTSSAHWLFGTGGVSSIFLAIYLIALPHASRAPISRGLGAYALIFGLVVLAAAVAFRVEHRRVGARPAIVAPARGRLP